MLGDRARAAAALRQRRAGGGRAPPHSGTAARRPRCVGARPRHVLPDAPHRQPLDVPGGRRDVRRGDESVPPRVPQRRPAAAGGRALPLPGWHGALLRLAAYPGAQRPLPHIPDRVRRLPLPTGLVKDRWNIRLVPHYWLGAFFVLAHLAAGARGVMMAHGVSKAFADRFMVGGAVVAGLVATVIMLGMCGMR